jgi:hypothetical protein
MKLFAAVIFCLLAIFFACSCKKESVSAPALQFNWKTPVRFQVVEKINKKDNKKNISMRIRFTCELVKTNQDYFLNWLDAKIIAVNDIKVSESEELKQAMEQLEPSFHYPTFHIDSDGQFLETVNMEDYLKRTDKMIDTVVPTRSEENRRFFSKFSKSETGKTMIDQIYGQIWQTWVETWAGLQLAEGQSKSISGTNMLMGGTALPATATFTNYGRAEFNTNLQCFGYYEYLDAANFDAALNKFIKTAEQETGEKSAGPLTNRCTAQRFFSLSVQTDQQTLMPHWASRSVEMWVHTPGEPTAHSLEEHEYFFKWNTTNAPGPQNKP